MRLFRDKVALITGASSGIGQTVALKLAQQGARVGLVSRNREALDSLANQIRQAGSEALVIPTDVTRRDQCERAVIEAAATFGQLDMVICSAGVSMRSVFTATDPAAMEAVMQVNFYGTLFVAHAALPHLQRSKGSLVAISSLVGKRGTPTYSIYGASKFAVQGLFESLRIELAPLGIHVGVVSPGHVATPLREQTLGPDGKPWATPPTAPFRVWPVNKVADRVIRLLHRRQAQALLPWFVRPMLGVEQFIGTWLGDRIIAWAFRRNPLPDRSW